MPTDASPLNSKDWALDFRIFLPCEFEPFRRRLKAPSNSSEIIKLGTGVDISNFLMAVDLENKSATY